MKRKSHLKFCGELFAVLLVLAGCTPYTFEPLTTNHPAHPGAIAAPEPPPSQTLAYTNADRPLALPVTAPPTQMKMKMMKGGHGSGEAVTSGPQTAVGEGIIVAVVPSSGQIVLEHGAIKDFMDAMTMGYRVEATSLLEGLKPGDQVRFTIDIEKKAIIKVEKLIR